MAKPATTNTDGTVKVKRTRAPSAPRKVYTILQVLDEAGEPTKFDKSRVRIVSFEKSGEDVLEKVESGNHPHAFYLRGEIPAGR